MLSNVFEACGSEPNTVPLETLVSYSNYRQERYAIQRTIILLMLTVFLLLPLLFVAAGVRIEITDHDSASNPLYTLSVSSRIPIRRVQASMDGRNLPVYEIAPGEYQLQPRSNGEMHVSVTLVNHQRTTVNVDIEAVDTCAPALIASEIGEDCVLFYVSDESGVDYENITVTDPHGNVSKPIGFDAEAGYIMLPYPTDTLDVRIPDLRSNALEVVLKPEDH